ncbi:MAG: hypothetical protein AB8G99_18735 [Planctomycetaceae bacterium]
MRRLLSSAVIGMFAFGFCVGIVGCGENTDSGDTTSEKADADKKG